MVIQYKFKYSIFPKKKSQFSTTIKSQKNGKVGRRQKYELNWRPEVNLPKND